jgi:hypothetical protein
MKDETTTRVQFTVPPALQWVLTEGRRPRSPAEVEAGRRLILGEITFGEYFSVLQEARTPNKT